MLAVLLGCTAGLVYAGGITISVEGDRISTDINDAPLGKVLEELATHMPLTVKIGDTEAAHAVSSHINNASLGQLLSQILRGKSYILTVDQNTSALDSDPSQKPSKLVIFPAEASAGGNAYNTSQEYTEDYDGQVYEEPIYEEPVYDEPVYEEPVYEDAPVDDGSSGIVEPGYEE